MAERLNPDIIGEPQESPMMDVYAAERKVASSAENRLKDIAARYSKQVGQEPPKTIEEQQSDLEKAGKVVWENMKEVPTAIGVGAVHGVQEIGNTAIALVDAVENYTADKMGFDPDTLIKEGQKLRFAELTPDMKTPAGKVTKFISQLLVGFKGLDKVIKYGKGAKGLAKVSRNMLIGAGAEAIATATEDDMAVDMFYQYFPEAKNPVMDFLASNPKDSEATKRFKKFTEGFFLEGLGEAVFAAFKLVRAKRVAKNTIKDKDNAVKQMIDEDLPLTPDEVAAERARRQADLPPLPDADEATKATAKETPPKLPDTPDADEATKAKATAKATAKETPPKLPDTPDEAPPEIPETAMDEPPPLNEEILRVKREVKTRRQAEQVPPPLPQPKDSKFPQLYNIKDTDGVRREIKKMVKGTSANIPKTTVTREETKAAASQLGLTYENMEEVITKEGYSSVELQALIDLTKKTAEEAKDQVLKLDPDNISAADEMLVMQQLEQLEVVTSITRPAASDQGRGLQLFKQTADIAKKDRIYKELRRKYGKDSMPHIVKAMKEIEARGGVESYLYWKALIERPWYVKIADASSEFLVNRFLGSVATQGVNLFSGIFNTATQPAVRKYAEIISSGAEGSVQKGEAKQYVIGVIESFKDAVQAAKMTYKTGQSNFYSKYDLGLKKSGGVNRPDMISSTAFDLEDTSVGKAIDVFGRFQSLPSRILNGADEFFKVMNNRGELHALALRESRYRQMAEGLSDEAADKLRQKLLKDPTFEMQLSAKKQAEYATFTENLNDLNIAPKGFGKINFAKIEDALRGNALGRVVVPFIRTPTNIVSQTLEHSPIAFLQESYAQAIRQGGVQAEMAAAKAQIGTAVMGFGAYLAAQGVITGDGPTDRRALSTLRQLGWKPNSIKTPTGWVPLSSLGVVGEVLSKSAQAAEVLGHASRTDNPANSQFAIEAGAFIGALFTPDSLTDGVLDTLKVIEGDKYALENLQRSTMGQFTFGRTAESLRGFAGTPVLDKYPRGEKANLIWDSIVNNFKAAFPQDFVQAMGAQKLYPKLNMFGKEVPYYALYQDDYQYGALSGKIHPSIVKFIDKFNNTAPNLLNDRRGFELLRIAMPQKALITRETGMSGMLDFGTSYELNNEQYYKYVRLSAGLDGNKINGKTLEEALVHEIDVLKFRNLPIRTPETTMERVIDIIKLYRDRAKEILKTRDPELRREFFQQKLDIRREKLSPTNQVNLET